MASDLGIDLASGPGDARPGPLCFHQEPTVLTILNGRKVYVCSRYPMHHCRTCCPVDVFLLDDAAQAPAQPPEPPSPTSPHQGPMAGDNPRGSPPLDAMASLQGGTTPSSQHLTTPRAAPPAPSKSHTSSVTSKAGPSGAVRSLTPIFNGFTAAAMRANQLGGRYVSLRPRAHALVRMQRQMSGSLDQGAGRAGSKPAVDSTSSRKRPFLGLPASSAGTGGATPQQSVGTVSRGIEPRAGATTTWMRHPSAATLPRE